jgi:CheY-specific phosphatase CheX
MDVGFINPFITSTRHVFDTMIHVPLTLGKASIRPPNLQIDRLSDVAVAIELRGGLEGLVVLHFTKTVALSLVSALTGEPQHELNADARDALGEIASMIVGGAKKDLPCDLVTISTPRVMSCTQIEYPAVGPILLVPFQTPLGTTPLIEVTFRKNPAGENPNAAEVAKAA